MRLKKKVIAMGTRQKWVGTIVILAVLLLISAVPGHTDRGGDGYRGSGLRGHGYRGHGHRRPHGYGGPRVFISPRIVVPFGPYWEPYGYPPVVIAPSPRIYVQPLPLVAAQPPPPVILVLLRGLPSLLPLCPTVPRGMEGGDPHATIDSTCTRPRDRTGRENGVGCPRMARARWEPPRHGVSASRLTQAALPPPHGERPEGRLPLPPRDPFWGRLLGNWVEGPWQDRPPWAILRVAVNLSTPRRATMSSHSRITEWPAMIRTHLPTLSKPQATVLALWSVGMVRARSSALTAVATFLAVWWRRQEQTVRPQLREWCSEAEATRGDQR
jgi:hypothetical protein